MIMRRSWADPRVSERVYVAINAPRGIRCAETLGVLGVDATTPNPTGGWQAGRGGAGAVPSLHLLFDLLEVFAALVDV